jgi:hypothetical protein
LVSSEKEEFTISKNLIPIWFCFVRYE